MRIARIFIVGKVRANGICRQTFFLIVGTLAFFLVLAKLDEANYLSQSQFGDTDRQIDNLQEIQKFRLPERCEYPTLCSRRHNIR